MMWLFFVSGLRRVLRTLFLLLGILGILRGDGVEGVTDDHNSSSARLLTKCRWDTFHHRCAPSLSRNDLSDHPPLAPPSPAAAATTAAAADQDVRLSALLNRMAKLTRPPDGIPMDESRGDLIRAPTPPAKVAILYHGAFDRQGSRFNREGHCSDFLNQDFANHYEMMIRPLREKGESAVSVFFHTYNSGCRAKDEFLVKVLKPVRHAFSPAPLPRRVDSYIRVLRMALSALPELGGHPPSPRPRRRTLASKVKTATSIRLEKEEKLKRGGGVRSQHRSSPSVAAAAAVKGTWTDEVAFVLTRFDVQFTFPLDALRIDWQSTNVAWRDDEAQWQRRSKVSDLFVVLPANHAAPLVAALDGSVRIVPSSISSSASSSSSLSSSPSHGKASRRGAPRREAPKAGHGHVRGRRRLLARAEDSPNATTATTLAARRASEAPPSRLLPVASEWAPAHYFAPFLANRIGARRIRFIDGAYRTSAVDARFLLRAFPELGAALVDGAPPTVARQRARDDAPGARDDALEEPRDGLQLLLPEPRLGVTNDRQRPAAQTSRATGERKPEGIFLAIDRSCEGKERDLAAENAASMDSNQQDPSNLRNAVVFGSRNAAGSTAHFAGEPVCWSGGRGG